MSATDWQKTGNRGEMTMELDDDNESVPLAGRNNRKHVYVAQVNEWHIAAQTRPIVYIHCRTTSVQFVRPISK